MNDDFIILNYRKVVNVVDSHGPLRGEVGLAPVVEERHAAPVRDEEGPPPVQTDVVNVEVPAQLPRDGVAHRRVEVERPQPEISSRCPAVVRSVSSDAGGQLVTVRWEPLITCSGACCSSWSCPPR